MKLFHKFFLTLFITNLIIVGLFLIAISVNLNYDLTGFMEEAEEKHVQQSIQKLSLLYQAHQSWQPIVDDMQVWRDIVSPKSKKKSEKKNTNFLNTGRRMSIYTADKKVIIGRKDLEKHSRIYTITANNNIVGWIGVAQSNALKANPVNDFLIRQHKNYYLIAAAAIVLSALMAVLLAKHFSKSIKQLVRGTNQLSAGEYDHRIKQLSNDELGILSDNFNNLASTLEDNQHNRKQWVSDTSHELKTPLTVLKLQMMAIQDGIIENTTERIGIFVVQINKLCRIVEDLYQLSEAEIGGLTYKKRSHNVPELIQLTLHSYQSKFEQLNMTVTNNIDDQPAFNMMADKERLLQLFSNLFENSCRYTDPKGRIHVQVDVSEHELIIEVQDSAPGVPKEHQKKLFERFFQVDAAQSKPHGGTGLGLALCTKIVNAHHGSISSCDSPLGGLSIVVRLPADHHQ